MEIKPGAILRYRYKPSTLPGYRKTMSEIIIVTELDRLQYVKFKILHPKSSVLRWDYLDMVLQEYEMISE